MTGFIIAAGAGEEMPPKMQRVVEVMAEICGAIHIDLPFRLTFTDDKMNEILVSTPIGEFYVIDSGHDDHWTGAIMHEGSRAMMGRCFELHQVLFMSMSTLLDTTMRNAVAYRDGMPPPHERH